MNTSLGAVILIRRMREVVDTAIPLASLFIGASLSNERMDH